MIGFIIILLGGYIASRGYKKLDLLKKYEFENTTQGGVVEFDSYEKSKNHESKKAMGRITFFAGIIVFWIGFLFMVAF
ncbi:hypothetical protein [Algoriphagus hitonicola]|uniref:Uncharacterized protein n=1 Tax=Algoriphagus hitonicola TaxID=435880 RepID=A0A1I2QMC4_9BACT|nr:hypothetical protein [Algoriphagus hitonicola]SFG27377.1 hypothetical protein SAMN04487988_102267 [Algoriphagus hitonicola]